MLRFDSETWDHPDEFRPSRFTNLNENKLKELSKIAESVFSYGQRVCPARKTSEYIMKIFIAYIANNFDWQLVEDKQNENKITRSIQLAKIPAKTLVDKSEVDEKVAYLTKLNK